MKGAEIGLQVALDEIGVVEDERVAEAGEVDDEQSRQNERKPGEIAPGKPHHRGFRGQSEKSGF